MSGILLWAQGTGNPAPIERLLAAGRYAEALSALDRAPAAEKQSGEWHLLASKAYDGLNDPKKAVEEAEDALATNPRDERYHLQLGQIFLSRNTPQAANEIFNSALKLFPDSLPLLLGRGISLLNLGRYEAAERDFETCLQKNPGLGIAFESLETAYLQTSRPELAAHTASAWRTKYPDDYRGHYFFAAAEEQLAPDSGAERKALEEALRAKPDYAPAKVLEAKMALRSGHPNEALALLQEAVRLRFDYPLAHVELAKTYRALGRSADATRELEILKRLSDQRPQSLAYHRGSDIPGRQ